MVASADDGVDMRYGAAKRSEFNIFPNVISSVARQLGPLRELELRSGSSRGMMLGRGWFTAFHSSSVYLVG